MRNLIIGLFGIFAATMFVGCAETNYLQYSFGGVELSYPILEEFEIQETGTIIQFKTILLGKEKDNFIQVQIKEPEEYFEAYPIGFTNKLLLGESEAVSINLGKGFYLYSLTGNDGERHIFLNATLWDKNWNPWGTFELEYPAQNLLMIPGKKGSYQNVTVLETRNCTVIKKKGV